MGSLKTQAGGLTQLGAKQDSEDQNFAKWGKVPGVSQPI